MKKILALLVAVMMVSAMMTVAMAEAAQTTGNGENPFGDSTTGKAHIGTLANETYTAGFTSAAFNVHFDIPSDNTHRPKTQFSYSITNGTAVSSTASTPAIYAGITGGVTLPSTAVTDAWNTVNSDAAVDTIDLTFVPTVFPQPGIYRYVLTEASLTPEQTAIGITDGTLDTTAQHTTNVLYLDVYVSTVDNALAVTGAVLLDNAAAPTLSDSSNPANGTLDLATYDHKVDGFYNSYKTYSVTITKTVEGAAGDQSEFFPFKLALMYNEPANTDVSSTADDDDANTTICGQTVILSASSDNSSNATSTVGTSYAIGSTGGTANEYTDITIKHGGSVTITGLSKQAIVKLMETVDAGKGYNITSSVTGMDSSAGITASGAESLHTESSTYATYGTVNGSDNATIDYTNTRAAISPTGVVLRYAPYFIMAAAAVALLVVMARRKKDNEDKTNAI